MFEGFDPERAPAPYFARYRGRALALALFVHAALGAAIVWFELNRSTEEIIDVELDEPDIENLEVESEPELDVEEEPEPEPEPPKPRNEIQNVKEQTKDVSESDVAVTRAAEPDYENEPEPEKPRESAPATEPEQKVVKKHNEGVGDRQSPRPMPADASKPKPVAGNASPSYPEALRKQNVTGIIKVKLHVHNDGSVRGMKILKKQVSGTDDPALVVKAEKLFLKEVIAAVKTWKFEPAKLRGKTISVWWPVTIPFNLN